jgi:hypothetical protein
MSRPRRPRRRAARKIDKRTTTVYWLIPAEPYRELFRALIRVLAKEFDAPRFEPHVTFFITQDRHSLPRLNTAPIRLRVRDIAFSSKFTKTLFVRFARNRSLDRLASNLAGRKSLVRDPHLSLVYKKMSILAKREMAAAIKLPFRKVVFDSIKVMRCAFPTKSRADVEAWRELGT